MYRQLLTDEQLAEHNKKLESIGFPPISRGNLTYNPNTNVLFHPAKTAQIDFRDGVTKLHVILPTEDFILRNDVEPTDRGRIDVKFRSNNSFSIEVLSNDKSIEKYCSCSFLGAVKVLYKNGEYISRISCWWTSENRMQK